MLADSINTAAGREPFRPTKVYAEDEAEIGSRYLQMEQETDRAHANEKKANLNEVFTPEALAFYIDHPVEFIEDVFFCENEHGVLEPVRLEEWQKEVCNDLVAEGGGYESIAAGSGVGKSFLLSKIIYWFLTTRRGKVPCTAPTEHQLFDILWSELKKDYDNSPSLQKIFIWTQTKLFVRGHVATWFAVARTATVRKDGKVQEGLQGFHDVNLLYIIDEASGVADSSMAAVDGALTANNAKVIMTSNPTRLSGRFYNSHTKSSRKQGGPWRPWNIDCRNSKFVGKKYVEMMRLEHGEDSPIFKAKVAGTFPDQEENSLISKSDFLTALTGELPSFVVRAEDVPELETARPVLYKSPLFSSEEHEIAALQFFGRIGFKGLVGKTPACGTSAGKFRPPEGESIH